MAKNDSLYKRLVEMQFEWSTLQAW
jgi:hypothetical protein